MRPQDNRSQQSSLSLCDTDSGIRQSRRKIPHSDCSLQKSSTRVLSEALAKPHQAGEAYRTRIILYRIYTFISSCSAHQSEALPVRETQREESNLERTKRGTWLTS